MAATDNSIRTPLSSRRATSIAALDDDDIGPSPGRVSVGGAAKRCRPKPSAAAERCRPETHSQRPAAGNHHCTAQHYFKTNCASLINGTTNSIVLRFTHFVLRLTKRRRVTFSTCEIPLVKEPYATALTGSDSPRLANEGKSYSNVALTCKSQLNF